MEGEKPMNQASVKSFVVPVFPAIGICMLLAATAVPCRTTSRSIAVTIRAVREPMQPFKFLVVIVRDIWPGGSLKRDRHIEHGVIGVRALVDSGGIYVRLERRSHLAQRLGCSIELR